MPARVELKIYFDTICEYNAFCAGNGIQVETPIGMTDAMDAEPTLVEYDPVADGSVEAETPAPSKALLITCVGCLHQCELPELEPCATCNGGRNWTAKAVAEPAPAAPASGKKRGRPAKAVAPAAEETPPADPEPAVEASAATLDDAMAAGGRLVEACGNSNVEALAILKSMGFSRVSAMETPEQFAEFIRRCDEAVAAKGAGAGGIL